MKKMLKNILALVLAAVLSVGLLPIRASAATADFADVAGHWAIEDIRWARSHNVVDGVGNNRFEPEGKVSDAAMVKMLCDAFFGSEYAAYEAAHRADVERAFGGNVSWYSSRAYFFAQSRLLENVDVVITDPTSANADMSRNDMAMILCNVAARKGLTAGEADKAAAQTSIRDYGSIPATHREAVKTCYALKLLNGSDGYFLGTQGMTRAQACAVIHRMSGLLGGGMTTDPGTSTEPTVKDVQTNSEYWSGNSNTGAISGNAWTVTDNGFGDGRLNNGKAITPENVIELLAEAEKVWPTGTKWAPSGSNNNFYKSSGSVSALMMKTQTTGASVNASSNFACSGFAAMISDYLFGRDNNMFHRVTDKVNGIRPGDIVLMIDTTTNRVNHAFVATSTSYTEYEGNGTAHPGFVYGADGNSSGKVNWPGEYDSGTSEASSGYTWQVYSRYPASTATQPATPTTTPDPTPSTPDESNVKDIVVTSEYWSGNATDEKGQPTTTSGNAWTITDNGFGDGRLNNGKPITEENVIELLHEAEKIWPANMTWSNRGSGNNFYKSSGTVVSRMMKTANTGAVHNVGSNFGCGGYAAMISDYLFGRDSNNFHRVIDPTAIRPGDIIIQINTSTNYVSHVIVAVTAPGGSYTGLNGTTNANRAGYIHFTDGNNSNMVNWPGIYSAPTNASIVDGETWQIYSRYPA